MTEDIQEISDLSRDFFGNLYQTEGTQGMDSVLNTVPRKVSASMNAGLTKPYTEAEVKTALFQMYPMKALGPDGFPAHFFQRNWELCGQEVTESVIRIVRARQAWRLLQNPETLSAWILKAVYYPNTDLLNANLGAHPSQIWRSILEGRDTMQQGLVRRIGAGNRQELGMRIACRGMRLEG
ncbi:hypothetical protein QYE76_037526 [Lolium multiflorum]|uniref:Uncharacterized protein n=1 Tax=Lolium multiflorum TaxID=4521 RepID=A0AAD8VC61_LOLMU|nr:hypothetical protein QYE76_037526 [Lolium multiflorum]